MTKPRYPESACVAGSKDCRDNANGPSPESNAWIVNFNNGNSNDNDRNNKASVRAVRAPLSPRECQGAGDVIPLESLHQAWQRARRNKQPSANQLEWESKWIDRLLELQQRLQAGTWHPSPSTCFVSLRPKAREIHAPHFGDRVVHHWLVPQLEPLFERRFIHDSFSNRAGKGTHAAVDRLRGFVRQVASGQRGGWYLQLDIRNFFYSISRPILWQQLKGVLVAAKVSPQTLAATHALVRHSPVRHGVHYHATPEQMAAVPAHKQLRNAAPGCGLPIGNLSSQFFANVYMDALDQFVKHELKARRYVRYVDDFVLVHHDRDQLQEWHGQIELFLADRLRLALKPEVKLARLGDGIDFLGYVIRPTHTAVRRRVVSHAREALRSWQARHLIGRHLVASPAQLAAVRATWRSYLGHFEQADAHRLAAGFRAQFPWLRVVDDDRVASHHQANHIPLRIKA